MRVRGRVLAIHAKSKNREVMDIGTESELFSHPTEHSFQIIEGDGDGLAARLTDEMLVIVIESDMPLASLLPQPHLVDNPQAIEFVERSINRGGVDITDRGSHSVENRGGGEKIIVASCQHPTNRSPRQSDS